MSHVERASMGTPDRRLAFEQAMQRVRPGPRSVLYAVGGLLGSVLVPGIGLCGFVGGRQIGWAIVATTLAVGTGYLVNAYRIERAAPDDARPPQLLLAGVLLLAAGGLLTSLALGPGPMSAKRFDPVLVAGVMLAAVAIGIGLMMGHARRLMRVPAR
jgi:hypothetical protein